jgi:hypothetical protein
MLKINYGVDLKQKVINDVFYQRMDVNLNINLIDVGENKKEIQEDFCKK